MTTNGQAPPGPPAGAYGETFDGTGAVFLGRFTDGQNWVDYFPGIAQRFGVDISAVAAYLQDSKNINENATDFAIGGSTSGALNALNPALPSFPDQISAYLGRLVGRSPADDLIVIWIGANDFDFAAQIKRADTVANIEDAIAKLSGAGAKNFVVVTLPDLALTPQVKPLAEQRFLPQHNS